MKGAWHGLRRAVGRHARFAATMATTLAVLILVSVVRRYGPTGTGLVIAPSLSVGLVVLSRRLGLSWDDLGLSRRTLARGALYAAGAVVAVAALYALAAALPATRAVFLDARYQMPTATALRTALVAVPLGTVLLEEIAFRGVLLGLVSRYRGAAWGVGTSSALFGLWHVLPSMYLDRANQAVGLAETGVGRVGVVLAVVGFTVLAGALLAEVRRRSGSLLAAAGLHWATNGVGVLVVAGLYGHGMG